MPSKKIYCLIWQNVPLSPCSWKTGVFVVISESKWNLISLVINLTANSIRRLQISTSVYPSLVIVKFAEHSQSILYSSLFRGVPLQFM